MTLEQQPLTIAQYDTYRALKELTSKQEFSPTIRELATALGKGTTTAHESLKMLEKKGWVTMTGGGRGIIIHPGFNGACRKIVESLAGTQTTTELSALKDFVNEPEAALRKQASLLDSCIRVARGLIEAESKRP